MKNEIVRIESTRENQVTFPEINKGPEAKEKGLKYFPAIAILGAEYSVEGKMLAPGVTPVPAEYLKAVKGNEMVAAFFAPGGGMRVLDSHAESPTGNGFPASLVGLSNASATAFINACEDSDTLVRWLRDATGDVRDSALAKLQVMEAQANMKPPVKEAKSGQSPSA
jgi:hypothetical protein